MDKLSGLLAGPWGAVIKYGAIALVTLGLVTGAYFWAYNRGVDAERSAEKDRIIASIHAQLKSIDAHVAKVEKQKQKTQVITVRAKSEIIQYLPTDPKCNTPASAVRVLNSNRGVPSPVPK